MTAVSTREEWLQQAVRALEPLFEGIGRQVPAVRVSVGWPSSGGLGKKRRVVGECWKSDASEDGLNQIFISPVRGEEDTLLVLETLVHEIIHAIDDCESGHKGDFIAMAKEVGLQAPWTATTATADLQQRFEEIVETIGPLPTAAIRPDVGAADAPKKQSTRMLKAECINGTGYKVRLTRAWIDKYGPPICACCQAPMEVEIKEEEES